MSENKPTAEESLTVDRSDLELRADCLRWCCDEDWLEFDTTEQIEPIAGVIGQDDAMEALRFGLESAGPGQNIFVRGLSGTGRMTLVRQLLAEIRPSCRPAGDRCYVHDFERTDRPRALTLTRGSGGAFVKRINELIEFIRDDLGPALASDTVRARRTRLDEQAQERMRQLGQPFEKELKAAGLVLQTMQVGQTVQPVILPLIEGKPAPIERFQKLRADGTISDDDAQRLIDKISGYEKQFHEVGEKIREVQEQHREEIEQLYESAARALLERRIRRIERDFPEEEVRVFLQQLVEDLVSRRLHTLDKDADHDFLQLYRVNLVAGHAKDESCPIIVENTPTLQNLLGSIDREFVPGGWVRSDHMMIRAGSLLRADGGFLIAEARDLLSEPGAWKVLVRTLRTRRLEIVPSEVSSFWAGPQLKPEPIDVNVKVVLLADPGLYYMLDAYDADFPDLFKVLADFDTTIDRDKTGVRYYAGVVARIAREEELLPFSRGAVAALSEHGARIAARRNRLTTRFGRLADIAREASFIAAKQERATVERDAVVLAIRKNKRRADLPARKFRKLVAEGTIRVRAEGREVGQVNGLAVTHAGPLTYGFPTRITATIGPGTAGTINIEREAQLSGAIHTKGFYILGGLLRHLLRTRHPLAFSASIAFEQSYGGIDGDSASAAEMCCLLSALTGTSLRQDLAMTGAIDQVGNILPVGAVTEKAEGFFDTCQDLGLTGTQGVVIPEANAGDLMLRSDMVEACAAGRFHVYTVATIHDALETLTGRRAGPPGDDGRYEPNSLLHLAERKAYEYWKMALAKKAD